MITEHCLKFSLLLYAMSYWNHRVHNHLVIERQTVWNVELDSVVNWSWIYFSVLNRIWWTSLWVCKLPGTYRIHCLPRRFSVVFDSFPAIFDASLGHYGSTTSFWIWNLTDIENRMNSANLRKINKNALARKKLILKRKENKRAIDTRIGQQIIRESAVCIVKVQVIFRDVCSPAVIRTEEELKRIHISFQLQM